MKTRTERNAHGAGDSDVLLPPGVAQQQRRLLRQLYSGHKARPCPDCGGEGARTAPAVNAGWRPQKRICSTCRGLREVPA